MMRQFRVDTTNPYKLHKKLLLKAVDVCPQLKGLEKAASKSDNQIETLLESFWSHLPELPTHRIKVLRFFADIILSGKKESLETRLSFNLMKYSSFPINHDVCLVCSLKAQLRHHIISIKNGGLNISGNIIPLCKSCHARIHPWLNQSQITGKDLNQRYWRTNQTSDKN